MSAGTRAHRLQVQIADRRMSGRSLSQRPNPLDLAPVQVVGRHPAVGRFDDRQAERTGWAGLDRADVIEGRPVRIRLLDRQHDRPVEGRHIEPARLRVEGAAGPARAAAPAGHLPGPPQRRRRVERTVVVPLHDLLRPGQDLRCVVDQLALVHALALVRRRLGREPLGGRRPLAGHRAAGYRTVLNGPHGLAGARIEDVDEALLAELRGGLDLAAVDLDIPENRRRHEVVVPETVADRLEMPLAFARLAVERNEALGEQVVPQPVAAVPVVGRRAEGQIDEPEVFVRGDQRPHVRVARVLPGIVLPGLVPELPRLRNRVEGPAQLASHRIEAADVSGRRVGMVRRVRDRRADDHGVAADHDR